MSCGRLRCRKNIFVPDVDQDTLADSPMPVFLIEHPQGNVLFDTGPHPSVFQDAASRWGEAAKWFRPQGDETSGVLGQLKTIGASPDDIRYVISSHLHFDHSGGNQFFPRSTFLVSKKELEWARSRKAGGRGYFRADWDHPLNYREIDGELDLYGDDRLRIVPTPGHTPGHQALFVRLKEHKDIILSGDCVPLQENLLNEALSTANLDQEEALRTTRKLAERSRQENMFILHGHDPEQWESIKTAPAYYC
jgi:glyoxylase-like metal-dependent hydrolase (beta-lactamase superfamily II)